MDHAPCTLLGSSEPRGQAYAVRTTVTVFITAANKHVRHVGSGCRLHQGAPDAGQGTYVHKNPLVLHFFAFETVASMVT
jgi:hypothetical protein